MPQDGLTESEWALWRSLQLMGRSVLGALEKQLQAEAQISAPEFDVLLTLTRAEGSRARVRDLADMLSWEKSRVSHLVRRMEGRRLVARTDCEDDLRATWVELTETGKSTLATALPGYTATVRESLTTKLTPAEADELRRVSLVIAMGLDLGACAAEAAAIADMLPAEGDHVPTGAR